MTRFLAVLPMLGLVGCVPTQPPAKPDPVAAVCKAPQFAGLVGQRKAVLDPLHLPAGTRVIGPKQAVTQDFRPDRLNFEIDSSGLIAKIACY